MLQIYAMNVEGRNFTEDRWKRYRSEERLERAIKMRAKEQQLCLGAEILLNLSLKKTFPSIQLPALYERNAHGKPYLLSQENLYMNWSHSGSWVVCALADREVGIDLQYTGKEPGNSLIRRVLQPEEQPFYEKAAAERKQRLFYEYWVIKESFLKALGTGFYTSLATFYIRMKEPYPEIVRKEPGGAFTCRLLEFSTADYTAAVCIEGIHPELERHTSVKFLSGDSEI